MEAWTTPSISSPVTPQLGEQGDGALDDAAGVVVGRRQHLRGAHGAVVAEQDDVGERAADVDAEAVAQVVLTVAARPTARQHLAGVEDPVRVEARLDRLHQRDQVAVLLHEGVDLAEADAVLARARAAAREGVVDDVVHELLGRARPRPGVTCTATWRLPSPAWPRMPALRPSRSISARAKWAAPASSVSGTHTSVARSFVPGKWWAAACAASWRVFHSRARASGSRSWTISVAPSSSAIACTSSRSASTSSSLPAASTKRHGPSGYDVPE